MRTRLYLEITKLYDRYSVMFKVELLQKDVGFAEVIGVLQPAFDETIQWLKENNIPFSYRDHRFTVVVPAEAAMMLKLKVEE